MAKHFLYGVYIRTVFQQMRCERMAQRVWCDRLFNDGLGMLVIDELQEELA